MASPGVLILWSTLPVWTLWFCLTVRCITCDGHFENVALNKTCNMSSNYGDNQNHPAGAAVNGDTNGVYDDKNNCIHTKEDDKSWWQVNLGRPYPVYNITVWARTLYARRMAYIAITVDGQMCYQFPKDTSSLPQKNDINCTAGPVNGSVVRVSKNVTGVGLPNGDKTINVCEFQVWSCSARYWDSGCDRECGECGDGASCDKVTGRCDSGCKNPGLQLPLCTQECRDKSFGLDCNETCSSNCQDVCNKVSGSCKCNPGWIGSTCLEMCASGSYGLNCAETCGACMGNVSCYHVNGSCQQCKDNYREPLCKECKVGYYGPNCTNVCGTCKNGASCNRGDGSCESCDVNFKPPLCKDCADRYYGPNCSKSCSENCEGKVCDRGTGHCTCIAGWTPPNCTEAMQGAPPTPDSPTSPRVAAITGGAVGGAAVLVLVVVVVAVLCIRKRRRPEQNPRDTERITRSQCSPEEVTQPTNVYENLQAVRDAQDESRKSVKKESEQRHSWNKDDDSQKPTAVVKPNLASKPKPKPKPAKPAGAVYVNVDAGQGQEPRISSGRPASHNAAQRPALQPGARDDADVDPTEEARSAYSAYYNDVEYMTSQAVTLGLDHVQQYLLDKLRGHALDGQFEELPTGPKKSTVVGLEEENRPKNRFNSSILPYDRNRVVLHGDADSNNDYINASYIKGRTADKTYIAAQGPKTNSISDFWKMVWQEQTTHIVMLTNLTEGEKNKCAEYWPPKGVRRQYGSVNVTGLEVEQRADYVIRTFNVREEGGSSTRHVTQYHFVTWPDHHVPTATALADFWRTVVTSRHNQRSTAPLLVHCSAGVGRTGTFIALDVALDDTQNQSEIDIFHIVQRMREDRINMVQTKSQYRFVHEAILEAYTSRHSRLALLAFNSVFPHDIQPDAASDRIDTEYRLLNQMKVLLHKPSHTVAEHEDNVGKNRTFDILPDDSHIVHLTSYVRGRNQYINAVYMPTFFARQGCVVTQLPLPHTLVDIWRLVDGNAITTVISLGAEVDGAEENCCYWPRQEGKSLSFGPFKVTLTSRSTLGQCLTSFSLSLQSGDQAAGREVRLLQYTGWTGEVADNTADLLQLVDLVISQPGEGEEGRTPVVIQCLDGASKSGLFSAVCDAISRMISDQDVDVYMAVRHVQTVRPECVTSLVQYRYIYHVIQEYQRRNSVYNNA